MLPISESQLLLLKASMLGASEALAAWEKFCSQCHDDRIDQSFLSTVYYNLAFNHQLNDFLQFAQLKDCYYATYVENVFLFNAVKSALLKLLDSNIPVVVLTGLAFISLYYKNKGAKKLKNIDIMIPAPCFYEAAIILEKLGWRTFKCRPLKNYDPTLNNALTYIDETGNFSIVLHYHLLQFDLYESADDVYWKAAVPFVLERVTFKTLQSSDHLLHCCVYGIALDSNATLQCLADAYYILKTSEIDWNRFLFLSKQKSLNLLVVNFLKYLKNHFFSEIPGDVIMELDRMSVSWVDRRLYNLIPQYKNNRLKAEAFLFYKIRRNNKNKTIRYSISKYLRTTTVIQKLSRLPTRIFAKIKRAIANLGC